MQCPGVGSSSADHHLDGPCPHPLCSRLCQAHAMGFAGVAGLPADPPRGGFVIARTRLPQPPLVVPCDFVSIFPSAPRTMTVPGSTSSASRMSKSSHSQAIGELNVANDLDVSFEESGKSPPFHKPTPDLLVPCTPALAPSAWPTPELFVLKRQPPHLLAYAFRPSVPLRVPLPCRLLAYSSHPYWVHFHPEHPNR